MRPLFFLLLPHSTPGLNQIRQCGKMKMLDRLLEKLHARGHKVLIFSQVGVVGVTRESVRVQTLFPGWTHSGRLHRYGCLWRLHRYGCLYCHSARIPPLGQPLLDNPYPPCPQMTKVLDLLESYIEQKGHRACRIDGSIPWQVWMRLRTASMSSVNPACLCFPVQGVVWR